MRSADWLQGRARDSGTVAQGYIKASANLMAHLTGWDRREDIDGRLKPSCRRR